MSRGIEKGQFAPCTYHKGFDKPEALSWFELHTCNHIGPLPLPSSPFSLFVFLSFSDLPPPIPHVQGTIDLKGLADQGLLNRHADGHRITCPGIPKSVSLSTPFCIFQDTSTS
jgi:hypothetical protein